MKLCLICVASALVLVSASVPNARTPLLKCPRNTPVLFPNAPEPVYVLNARAVAAAVLKHLDRDSIAEIHILCAHDIYRVFAIEAQRSGVVVFTLPGPRAALKASLDTLVSLQQAHLAAHGEFARNLAALRWSDPAGVITVTLTVAEDGRRWSAFGTHRYLFGSSDGVTVSGEKPR